MEIAEKRLETAIIRFAGDSGDGMQLTGSQFTNTTALLGNDLSTLPDFPAEIRAPQGTIAGVSGFQIQFGSTNIHTPGDKCDILVAMNAAALKANKKFLKPGATVIANLDGFGRKDLMLAKHSPDDTPLEDLKNQGFRVYSIDITKMTKESLSNTGLSLKEIARCKNMFVLGIIYWLYNRPLDHTIDFLNKKFGKNPDIAAGNIKALNDGYTFGISTEMFTERYRIDAAQIEPGEYRNITGNEATALGVVAATVKSGIRSFYGSYPITPASDVLHNLSKYKNYNVYTYQAEDEIAAVSSAIGASFGGSIGITGSSGPGIALKTEAIALAMMYELPLVIINVQRAGPSTGMPTKTEQSDLLQALYGRAGECPVVVIAPNSPADCFFAMFEACKIAVEHMIPVMYLSDGYLANGAEPWKFPQASSLPIIIPPFAKERSDDEPPFKPYARDEFMVRPWAIPGTKGLEHRIGGIEKEHETGNISYDPDNHQLMTNIREKKRDMVAEKLPLQTIDEGEESGELLVIGWGGTYGTIKQSVIEARRKGISVSYIHLRHLSPFPKNLGDIISRFDKWLVPEINSGQLVKVIRDHFFVDAKGYNRVRGVPFAVTELVEAIENTVNAKS